MKTFQQKRSAPFIFLFDLLGCESKSGSKKTFSFVCSWKVESGKLPADLQHFKCLKQQHL